MVNGKSALTMANRNGNTIVSVGRNKEELEQVGVEKITFVDMAFRLNGAARMLYCMLVQVQVKIKTESRKSSLTKTSICLEVYRKTHVSMVYDTTVFRILEFYICGTL